jgi:hypothetical protein
MLVVQLPKVEMAPACPPIAHRFDKCPAITRFEENQTFRISRTGFLQKGLLRI